MTQVQQERPVGRRRVVTTEELKELVESGKTVRLRPVARPDDGVLGAFPESDAARLQVVASTNPVVKVEYVGDEPVRCISVGHPDHLYVTDDFMPTHNTSNIVFLKSTDESMIETLQKMSGTKNNSYIDSKTVTRDKEKLVKGLSTEGKVSYTMSTKEEPVISFNDMQFIAERNSIVFRAGDSPMWNRNETILPMSWRLFKDTIVHPGHEYTLQTIPTLSTSRDFDVRMNQPDFKKMLAKRMKQAEMAALANETYMSVYGYNDVDVVRLDPDVYSNDVMELVDAQLREATAGEFADPDMVDPDEEDVVFAEEQALLEQAEEDANLAKDIAAHKARKAEREAKIYARGTVSREMLVRGNESVANSGALDKELAEAFRACRAFLRQDSENFTLSSDGTLRSGDGSTVYITVRSNAADGKYLAAAAENPATRVYADEEEAGDVSSYEIHDEFYLFLASLPNWRDLAGGEFDRAMAQAMKAAEKASLSDDRSLIS